MKYLFKFSSIHISHYSKMCPILIGIDSILLVYALFIFSMVLLPACSWIHCCKKKKKKSKDKATEEKPAKQEEKEGHGFEAKVEIPSIPKKLPPSETGVVPKGEKKTEEEKVSPKEDQALQTKGVAVKNAEPGAKGKETAKLDENLLKFPAGTKLGQFVVAESLGAGGCGVVYKVIATDGSKYAMKLERMDQKRQDQLLPLEAHILKRLQFSSYAAKFITYGKCGSKEKPFRVLVMALLGKSIADLQDQRPKFKLTTGTVLRIGIQALRGIAFLHSIYYVHRDVKPANFAVDRENLRRVYLIDFGLSRSLKKRGIKLLRKTRKDIPFRGTPGYCSLNAHKRIELGRHDDLWSLIYMLVDLNNGSLPWFGQDTREKTAILKEYLIESEYMHSCPLAFRSIMDYLRTLNYRQRPDYVGLEKVFIQMLVVRNIHSDQPMDWEPLLQSRLKVVSHTPKDEYEQTQDSIVSPSEP